MRIHAQLAGVRTLAAPLALIFVNYPWALALAVPPEIAPADPGILEPTSEQNLADGIQGLVRVSRASAAQQVARVAQYSGWTALKPWASPLAKLRDARYWYNGRGFDAVIRDDGGVATYDKNGLILAVLPTNNTVSSRGQNAVIGIGLSDLQGTAARAAGDDPYRAERQLFLEQTRSLREHLADVAQARARQASLEKLTAALRQLRTAFDQHDHRESRDQMFEIWDGCAEDGSADIERTFVAQFVAEMAEQRGVCPFGPADLARLNARRRSKQAFAPCGHTGAGPDSGVSDAAADAT